MNAKHTHTLKVFNSVPGGILIVFFKKVGRGAADVLMGDIPRELMLL